MSRSGYSDDLDQWELIRWRGAVKSAMRGQRGQAFLRELLAALDALPEKRLIAHELVETDGSVCALGSVARVRGMDVTEIDPGDREIVAERFGIAEAMAAEIMFWNDEWYTASPEARFAGVRREVIKALAGESEAPATPEGGEG